MPSQLWQPTGALDYNYTDKGIKMQHTSFSPWN